MREVCRGAGHLTAHVVMSRKVIYGWTGLHFHTQFSFSHCRRWIILGSNWIHESVARHPAEILYSPLPSTILSVWSRTKRPREYGWCLTPTQTNLWHPSYAYGETYYGAIRWVVFEFIWVLVTVTRVVNRFGISCQSVQTWLLRSKLAEISGLMERSLELSGWAFKICSGVWGESTCLTEDFYLVMR